VRETVAVRTTSDRMAARGPSGIAFAAVRALLLIPAIVGLAAQPAARAVPADPPAAVIPWPLPAGQVVPTSADSSVPADDESRPLLSSLPPGEGDDESVPLLSTLPAVDEADDSVAILPKVTKAPLTTIELRPTIDMWLGPPSSVVAEHRLTLGSGPPGTKDRQRGKLTDDETSFLLPSIDVPTIGLDVLVDELTPPTPESRRWQFANTQGMTWEAQETEQDGDWVTLRGSVDVRAGLERIRADEIRLNKVTQRLEADGNVVLDRLDSRLTGSHLEYDINLGTGSMLNAMGYTRGELSFTADVAEKVGPTKYRLHGASFTSCTQPLPIWQIKATKATVEVDKFAYLWNPRVFFKKSGAWWFPWVAIPIKQERSTGFMIPRISNSSVKGFSASEDFFWAINRSADITVGGQFWQDYGWEGTLTGRWFGKGMTDYSYIEGLFRHKNEPDPNPKLKQERYDVSWEHRQTLAKWDITFTGEIGSDQLLKGEPSNANSSLPLTDYLNPIFNQRLTLQRRWGKHSLNIFIENDERERDAQPEQVVSGPPPDEIRPTIVSDYRTTTINRELPYIEWRASGIQPGGAKWISLNVEGSIGRFEKITHDVYRYPYDRGGLQYALFEDDLLLHQYDRADFFPQVRFPFGPSYLQVIPEIALRGTWWSRVEVDANAPATPFTLEREARPVNLAPVEPLAVISPDYTLGADESLFLWGYEAGLAFEGPDFERVYHSGAKPGERRWQHLIEPRIDYTYAPEVDHHFLIQGDQKVGWYTGRMQTAARDEGLQNEVALRLTNTLRSKEVVPEGSTAPVSRDVLIWTLSSTWNLELPETTATIEGRSEDSRFSNIESDFNIRPTQRSYVSLRNTYDIIMDDITRTSVVGGVEGNWGYTSLAFSSTRTQATLKQSNSEVTLTGENWFYKGGRIRFGYDITRDLEYDPPPRPPVQPGDPEPPPPPPPWIYRRFVLGYYNQCAGLQLSYEDNAARALEREKTWTFVVSLKDLGNYLRYRKSTRP